MGRLWSWLTWCLNVVKDTDSFHLFSGPPNWIGFCPPACLFPVSSATSLLDDYFWFFFWFPYLKEFCPRRCEALLTSILFLQKVTCSDSSWHSSESPGSSPGLVLRINLHLELKTTSSSGVGFVVSSPLPLHPNRRYLAALLLAWKFPEFQTSLLKDSPSPGEVTYPVASPFTSLCLSLPYLGRGSASHLQSQPIGLVTWKFCHYFDLNKPQDECPIPSLLRPLIV